MRLEDYATKPSYDATVLNSESITEQDTEVEVREIVMEVSDHDFDFEVGQSIGVLAPGPTEFGGSIHHRLYTVADIPRSDREAKPQVTIVVRRCNYIDDYSGEEYIGVNSNFLCDRRQGDKVTITGPFGMPFTVPADKTANLLLIGMGTGIAPFRAFVKHIYKNIGDWKGKVRVLYGAQSGLELLYMNDKRDDFTNYYDEDTFEAFTALSPRPSWADPISWEYAIEARAEEIWNLLSEQKTYVYIAGQKRIREALDQLFINISGSQAGWQKRKAELIKEERWIELIY